MLYIHGPGDGRQTACVLSAVYARWAANAVVGQISDRPPNVCPLLRELCIIRNDKTPLDALQQWAPPMVDRLVDSKRDDATTGRRLLAVGRRLAATVVADIAGQWPHAAAALRREIEQLRSAETASEQLLAALDAVHRHLSAVAYLSRFTVGDVRSGYASAVKIATCAAPEAESSIEIRAASSSLACAVADLDTTALDALIDLVLEIQ